MNQFLKEYRNIKKPVVSVILAFVLIITGIPFTPLKDQVAYAATTINVKPDRLNTVYGGKAEIKWTYDDIGHDTQVQITQPSQYNGYVIEEGYYPDKIENEIVWNGKVNGEPGVEGNYTIRVQPMEDRFKEFFADGYLQVHNPNPPSPIHIEIVPNLYSDSHIIRGIAEKGTEVSLEISYTRREGYLQVLGDTVVIPGIEVKDRKSAWALGKAIEKNYFTDFPFDVDNQPEDYVGEWETLVTLNAYEIANITATVKRTFDGKKSGKSEALRVLRFKAPSYRVTWEALSGYYYRAENIIQMLEGIKKIADDNGIREGTCSDGQACYGQIAEKTNLLIMGPELAGLILEEELKDLTREKIANRKQHPTPEWWDPINLSTGDFIFRQSTMDLQARMPLNFDITYHSRDKYDGDIGVGWHHTFEWRLEEHEAGNIYVVTPDGAMHLYTPVGNGNYQTPLGTYNTLVKNPNGTYTLESPQKLKYTFREDGRFVRLEDINGNQMKLTYQGTVLTQVSTDGASMTFTYGKAGKIEKITDHTGRVVQFQYNNLTHDLTKLIFADDAEVAFKYDDQHQLTEIVNPKKTSTLINEYDDKGRVIRQRDFNGAWGEIEYVPEQNKTITKDPLGRIKTFEYDDRYRQTAIHYPDGTVERFEYDHNDNMTLYTDQNGNSTRYTYDERGNLLQAIDPVGAVTDIQYNAMNLPKQVTDPLGNKTVFNYDQRGNVTSIVNALGQTSIIDRDAFGIPTQITNPNGEKVNIKNDAFGFVSTVTDPNGTKSEIKRDPLHRVTEMIDALGHISKIEYDPRDRIKTQIDALNQRQQFEYDKDSNLVAYTDVSGAKTRYTYDHFDRIIAVTDALNQSSHYTYDVIGNLIESIDPNGAKTTYVYDSLNRLKEVTDPEGNITRFAYDGNGNLVSQIDPNGGVISIAYDARNLPISITDATGGTTTYAYDRLGRLIQETNAIGNSTYYDYDALGRLITTTDALGFTNKIEYDNAGRINKMINANGATWKMEYDAAGQLIAIMDPMDNRSTMNRDALGRVIESIDTMGASTSYRYDALGRVTAIIDALGNQTSFSYDPMGRIKQVVDAKQQVTTYDYDSIGRLTGVINALNNRTSYAYDAVGNIRSKIDALGRVTSYAYNKNGQLIGETNPLGLTTSIAYDGNGNTVQVTYPDKNTTFYQYDLMNRLTDILYHDGKNVDYSYDLLGRRTQMSDWNGTTTYDYDPLNRLSRVTDTRNQTIRYEWTPTGQRSKVIYPDQSIVSYHYDLLDRMTAVTDGRGQTTSYTYDANGMITSKTFPNRATSEYRYDALGQMVELQHKSQRGKGKVLEHLLYSYDPVGNRIRTERIEDNDDEDKKHDDHKEHRDPVITNYAYDALNQLTQVLTMNSSDHESLIMTEYNYDAVGNRLAKRISWGDFEDLEEYTYDLADRLIHVQNGPSYRDYSYDPRGNLLKVFGLEYDYDHEMSVTQSVYNITNLLMPNKEPESVVQQVYGMSLLSSGGNHKPRVLEEYVWGSDNRLIQMINPKGDISRFAYDGDGNRIKMTVDVKRGPDKGRDEDNDNGNGNNGNGNGNNGNGKGKGHSKCDHVVPPGFVPPGLAKKCGPNDEFPEEHPGGPRDGWEKQHQKKHWEFHYTNDVSYALPQVLQVTEDDPTKWKELYTYGPGAERISMTYLPAYDHDNGWEPYPGAGGAEPGVVPKTLYYITDILGSNLGLMEPDGRMSARYHYDEFGMVLDSKKFDVNWPGPDNLIGYTGLEYDYYTGLNYARARYYRPEIGRFISKDTYEGVLGNPLSQNRYTYVENNPLRWIDPSGHIPTPLEAAYMAQQIYDVTDDDKDEAFVGDWTLIDIKYGTEGLKMGIYSKVKNDGTMEYALVNKGSSSVSDWINNGQQPFGWSTDMKESIAEAEYFSKNHAENEITMIGHSKGGAEAAANAVATNRNSIIFNPATVFLEEYGLSSSNYRGSMTAFIVKGDILNSAEGWFSKPIDKVVYLPRQYGGGWGWLFKSFKQNAKDWVSNGIKNHSMDAVIEALKEEEYD